MKTPGVVVFALAVLFAAGAVAAPPAAPPANPPDLQQLRELMGQTGLPTGQLELLREEAARAQACLAKIDPAAMAQLEQQARGMGEEVLARCNAGRRDEAQQLAEHHARTLLDAPVMKAVQACSSALPALLEALPLLGATRLQGLNVCDMNLAPPAD